MSWSKCGIGKVNAALCAQTLIDKFSAVKIIFTGVAGAADPELDIGDEGHSFRYPVPRCGCRCLWLFAGPDPLASRWGGLSRRESDLIAAAKRATEGTVSSRSFFIKPDFNG